jgi:hypothetical protein
MNDEVLFSIKKYVETTQMQSFVEDGSVFSISNIEEKNDSYLVSYVVSNIGVLSRGDVPKVCNKFFVVGSTCVINKSSLIDLIRNYKIEKLIK